MKKTIEQLKQDYLKLLNSQYFVEEDLDYSILEKHIPYLEKISELSNSAIMIFDLYKKEHIYVSKNIANVLELDHEKSSGNSEYIDECIFVDDMYDMLNAGLYFLGYAHTLKPDYRKNVKLVNEYRIINHKNKFVRVIEQQLCLENDKHGNLWLGLGILDISPDQAQDAPFRSRMINSENGNVYLFPPPNEKAILTLREKEILKLISKGLISKEIADKLFISVNTVNTHRQRILEKLEVENSIEAIKYAVNCGII